VSRSRGCAASLGYQGLEVWSEPSIGRRVAADLELSPQRYGGMVLDALDVPTVVWLGG
jgi:hypothetical protein